jgi:hypothetical protein
MIVSIHQPQYLPWLPYLLKISASDLFIVLDSVDFTKNGLQNRNQIKITQGKAWLTVPVKQKLGQKIKDVEINQQENGRKKHWQTLEQNYQKAPFFHLYARELNEVYDTDWKYLIDLNLHLLQLLIKWFGISCKLIRSSNLAATGQKMELILNLCKAVGAGTYLSGVGAKDYLEEEAFAQAGIELIYKLPVLPKEYPQQHQKSLFINDLSAIDLILNCGESWEQYVGD